MEFFGGAADVEFNKLWDLVADNENWKLEYQREQIQVWTREHSEGNNLKMVKVIQLFTSN